MVYLLKVVTALYFSESGYIRIIPLSNLEHIGQTDLATSIIDLEMPFPDDGLNVPLVLWSLTQALCGDTSFLPKRRCLGTLYSTIGLF